MSRAVLSIGSNLGDRLALLRGVVDAMRPWLLAVSPVYETEPWGADDAVPQDDYLNAVLVVADPAALPRTWLDRAHAAERAAGRTRGVHWGPRTLDVDVLAVDDVVSADPELTLPHPRAGERAFVLVPWADADPDATLAGVAVAQLRDALPAGELADVRPRTDLVLT